MGIAQRLDEDDAADSDMPRSQPGLVPHLSGEMLKLFGSLWRAGSAVGGLLHGCQPSAVGTIVCHD